MSDFCPHGVVENDKNCPSCMEEIKRVKVVAKGQLCACPEAPYDTNDIRLYTGIMCPSHGLFRL